MVNYIAPKYSKTKVNSAGDTIRDYAGTTLQQRIRRNALMEILENWRASHAYILNTFQANLRRRTRGSSITVGQRLKRRPTIIDKLKREPGMKLARMHDIAGCRVIFDTEKDLLDFRASLHSSRMKHKRKNGEIDRYNYIDNPKSDGYRGIHDVYEYNVTSANGITWNGLLIEIQYRTRVQHAWATAVEVADLTTSNRVKFGEGNNAYQEFFRLASEILTRAHESHKSCLPQLSDQKLVMRFNQVDKNIGLLEKFRQLNHAEDHSVFRKHTILSFELSPEIGIGKLTVETFSNVMVALERYVELEEQADDGKDVVLIQSTDRDNIREAFKNYFSDATTFIELMENGIDKLT